MVVRQIQLPVSALPSHTLTENLDRCLNPSLLPNLLIRKMGTITRSPLSPLRKQMKDHSKPCLSVREFYRGTDKRWPLARLAGNPGFQGEESYRDTPLSTWMAILGLPKRNPELALSGSQIQPPPPPRLHPFESITAESGVLCMHLLLQVQQLSSGASWHCPTGPISLGFRKSLPPLL